MRKTSHSYLLALGFKSLILRSYAETELADS